MMVSLYRSISLVYSSMKQGVTLLQIASMYCGMLLGLYLLIFPSKLCALQPMPKYGVLSQYFELCFAS